MLINIGSRSSCKSIALNIRWRQLGAWIKNTSLLRLVRSSSLSSPSSSMKSLASKSDRLLLFESRLLCLHGCSSIFFSLKWFSLKCFICHSTGWNNDAPTTPFKASAPITSVVPLKPYSSSRMRTTYGIIIWPTPVPANANPTARPRFVLKYEFTARNDDGFMNPKPRPTKTPYAIMMCHNCVDIELNTRPRPVSKLPTIATWRAEYVFNAGPVIKPARIEGEIINGWLLKWMNIR